MALRISLLPLFTSPPLLAPVLHEPEESQENEIGRGPKSDSQNESPGQKGGHDGASGPQDFSEYNQSAFLLVDGFHHGAEDLVLPGKPEDPRANFIRVEIEKAPAQGIRDPGAYGCGYFAPIEKDGEGHGKSGLKWEDGEHAGEDT